MSEFVLAGDIAADIVFPEPKDEYDEELQRQLRDYLNRIADILKTTEEA